MRSGALAAALLCAALGLALSFAPRRAVVFALAAFVVAALLSLSLTPAGWVETAFIGCWISLVVLAACLYLPKGIDQRLAVLLGLNVGVWAGAVTATAAKPVDLALAAPWVLLALPGAALVAPRLPIVIRVLGSWLVAVAILAVSLPVASTPSYEPDHME